jgi:phage shock protein PspC (stress-responsive transcriptional regulator)
MKRSDDRMVGGVAGGIAEYLVLDSTVVRMVFVLLFILGVWVTW